MKVYVGSDMGYEQKTYTMPIFLEKCTYDDGHASCRKWDPEFLHDHQASVYNMVIQWNGFMEKTALLILMKVQWTPYESIPFIPEVCVAPYANSRLKLGLSASLGTYCYNILIFFTTKLKLNSINILYFLAIYRERLKKAKFLLCC